MSAPLTFHLLGGAAIARPDHSPVDFRSRTAEALLIYLACHDRPLSRQFLADFFWDDRTQKQASANLRSALSMLRKQVAEYLTTNRQMLSFNHKREHWIDSAEFASQIQALEPQLSQTDSLTDEAIEQLKATMALYQGDFLAGFHLRESRGFEEWILIVREKLRRLAVFGFRHLAQHHLENGRFKEGITYANQLIKADPYNEEAQRQRMWLLIRSGQRNTALQSYQAFTKLLDQDLGVEPTPATTAVFEKISSLNFPPPANIPIQSTPFVGREKEIDALLAILTQTGGRLITLVGQGGIGKTRLALQVANKIKSFHPGYFLDGIWFVPLASVPSGHFLTTAIANALDLSFRGSTTPREQLLKQLQNRELLLILDNFEHFLVDDDFSLTLIEDILNYAPKVKLILTSKEQLNLKEEQIFDIEGLPYPQNNDAESALSFSAVQLFIEQTKRISRYFEPGENEIEQIIRLCQLLEGLPLGLEMAAAWIRQYSIAQIVSRLEQNLEALTSTWRNVPQRHQSLQSVFDHSWQLLTAEEQISFAPLAVFRGGFSPEAAMEVAGVPKPALFQAKSLLRKEENGRFDMHNLIRQFTAEMLRRDETAYIQALRNHAHYYLEFLKEQESYLTIGSAKSALSQIALDLENIRRAWKWAIDNTAINLLNQSYLSLYLYYETKGWFEEGESIFRESVAALEKNLGPIDQLTDQKALIFGRLQSRAGWFAYRCGQLNQAIETTQKTMETFQRLDAKKDLAQSLNDLGILVRRSGDYEKGKSLLLDSLAIRRELNEERDIASTLNNLANAVRMLGEYDQARRYLLESINLLQEQGNLILLANAYNDLGEISRATGEYEAARKHYEESLAIRQKIDNPNSIAICLNNLGSVAHTQGDYEAARHYAQESLTLFIQSGNRRAATYPLSVLGRIARDESDFPESFATFRRALHICYDINYVPKSLDILFELSTVLEATNQPKKAIQLLAFVITHPKLNHETRKAAESLFNQLATTFSPELTKEMEQIGRNDTLEAVIQSVLRRELEKLD